VLRHPKLSFHMDSCHCAVLILVTLMWFI
jgi:hypothetical protein